jgi:predicted nucleic acid-binding protein
MPVAVSDSSTLIHLAVLGRLVLLREFYGQVLIPPAVWKEVVEEGKGRAGGREVEEAARSGWLRVIAPANEPLVRLLKRDLDAGEAEAIALAVEQQADMVLLDESDARRVAGVYGVPKSGVLGLLVRGRLEGKLPSLRQELARLRQDAGFWIDEDLCRRALEAVGEGRS